MATDAASSIPSGTAPRERLGILVLLLALLPSLCAIWGVPWFVTQDGPAHLYNAHIIAESRDANSPFAKYYTVRWEPLPNWGGHLVTTLFVSTLPLWAAGPAATTLTLVAFAGSIVWLRLRVAGPSGLPLAALMAVLLGLNFPWLLGFTSFMLGACLFPITLGVWWGGRDTFGWGRVAALAGLIVLGYVCHLVSLGLTAAGLVCLALFTPGPQRRARLARTAVAMLPLVPLGLLYLSLSTRGGRMHPVWEHLTDLLSPAVWATQIAWVDPITLATKKAIPLTKLDNVAWFGLFAPLTWLLIALLVMWISAIRNRATDPSPDKGDRAGWTWLVSLLLIGGVLGPDTLGDNHGGYLPQRVVLLGLVALVPILNLELEGWSNRLTGLALLIALSVQSSIVWDYALTSRRTAGTMAKLREVVGSNQRVATLLIDIRTRFRANPLLHSDNLLGVGTRNIIWNNYETLYYYFPVQFRPEVKRPNSSDLELIAVSEGPTNANFRASIWNKIVAKHIKEIDAVVVWGSDPKLDAINQRLFKTAYWNGNVRVLRPIKE